MLADEQLCDRVFVNLILNAYQAMEARPNEGPQILRIEIASESSNGKAGVGVPSKIRGPGFPPKSGNKFSIPFLLPRKMVSDWVFRSWQR